MEIKEVEIPSCSNHEGMPCNVVKVKLYWVCPKCGKRRNEPHRTLSYDGSLYLTCDGWNSCVCGNSDYYSDVRKEAMSNGLN